MTSGLKPFSFGIVLAYERNPCADTSSRVKPMRRNAELKAFSERVLTKDRPEYQCFFEEGFDIVVEMMEGSQRQVNHFDGL